MGRWRKNSKEAEIKRDLFARFSDGERITKAQAITDYFTPKTDYKYLVAQRVMNAIFNSVSEDFQKTGTPFGALNSENEHGIPETKEEYEFMGITRYKLIKGIINGSEIIVKAGVQLGLITGETKSERIPLPVIEQLQQLDE